MVTYTVMEYLDSAAFVDVVRVCGTSTSSHVRKLDLIKPQSAMNDVNAQTR